MLDETARNGYNITKKPRRNSMCHKCDASLLIVKVWFMFCSFSLLFSASIMHTHAHSLQGNQMCFYSFQENSHLYCVAIHRETHHRIFHRRVPELHWEIDVARVCPVSPSHLTPLCPCHSVCTVFLFCWATLYPFPHQSVCQISSVLSVISNDAEQRSGSK